MSFQDYQSRETLNQRTPDRIDLRYKSIVGNSLFRQQLPAVTCGESSSTKQQPASNGQYIETCRGTNFEKDSFGKKNDLFLIMSEQVAIYQKDVGELSKTVKCLGKSSTISDEWECKQQVQKIEQRGDEIDKYLQIQEARIQKMTRTESANARSSHLRLTRDFRFVQSSFKALKLEFRKWKDQYSRSRYKDDGGKEILDDNDQNKQCARINEDEYALQVMQEREEAIGEINKKMHHVNEIYKDLGQIVSNQQEHIDLVENTVEQSKNNTKLGLSSLEHANQEGKEREQNHQHEHMPSLGRKAEHMNQNYRTSSNCGLNLAIDMSEVRKDLKGIGSGVFTLGKSTLKALQLQMMKCATK